MISTVLEEQFWNNGILIAGVDEAGRGAFAGPVVAGAVIFDPKCIPVGIDDSKRLSAKCRMEVSQRIKLQAIAWSVAFIDHNRIDEVNILQATYDAMHKAIDACRAQLQEGTRLHCLVDGNRFRTHELPHTNVIHGDALSTSIAAASILAKTARDQWMTDIAVEYPTYQFARHKGYGTLIHRSAIKKFGPCEIHRRTFLKKLFAESIVDVD